MKSEDRDKFIKSMILPQSFAELAQEHIEVGPTQINKPRKGHFFSISPLQPDKAIVYILSAGDWGSEFYAIAPDVYPKIADDCAPCQLVVCQYRHGSTFLWPVRITVGGRLDNWSQSAHRIILKYPGEWIRLKADMAAGQYDVILPLSPLDPPIWNEPPEETLRSGLEFRSITTLDHPVIRRLLGQD